MPKFTDQELRDLKRGMEFALDNLDRKNFPQMAKRWKSLTDKLWALVWEQ